MTKEQYKMLKCLVEYVSEATSNNYIYDDEGNSVRIEDCRRWLESEDQGGKNA